jgi:hypothetical protein
MPGQIKIDDGAGNYTVLTNGGSLGSDKTITIPNTTGTMALTSDISAGGLEAAQQFRLTANITTNGTNVISTNISAPSNLSFGSKGSLVSESSGIFSFSETGFYMVNVSAMVGGGKQCHIITQVTTDDTNYTDVAGAGTLSDTSGVRGGGSSCILDITDITNMKVRFSSYMQFAGATIYGSTTANNSVFTFLKLGDT